MGLVESVEALEAAGSSLLHPSQDTRQDATRKRRVREDMNGRTGRDSRRGMKDGWTAIEWSRPRPLEFEVWPEGQLITEVLGDFLPPFRTLANGQQSLVDRFQEQAALFQSEAVVLPVENVGED